MKRLENHMIGIDQGDIVLFSDFKDGGDMWTGSGQRERRHRITFETEFLTVPSVQVSISMWDVDAVTALRADVSAEVVSEAGFEAVFRTWGDTRVARVRVAWMAIGALRHADEWELY